MLSEMLKSIKDKVLLGAFLVLCVLCSYQYIHYHSIPPREIVKVQLVPTIVYKEAGKEHSKVQEVVVQNKKQMQELTKQDRKILHTKNISSSTEIVDHNSLTMSNDTVRLIHYDTKKWFLAHTIHNIDITHTDTSIHSTFAQSITYKEPKVMFVAGPYIGYDVLHNHIALGVSITFNVFSFKYKK